ncbi:MAG: 4Fe-4S dicluster domain-containing protein [candidate division Zixibacteria bacterium]|nr:4Fe-4S dicluster domain-containing protein [candidate division Zixibacteria bacterium]
MVQYYHAHKVVSEKCRGHMSCMRHCPSQAIRVREGKAVISEELCVDCGTCISVCPSGAIVPITDPVSEISNFKYKVVVPSPVLYCQFESNIHPYIIHLAFKRLGFDEVADVSTSSAALARALVKYMKKYKGRLPLISSHCPSMLRLIQVKYPDLVELVVPMDVPREVTARQIRRTLPAKLGLKPEDIGIIYLAPCPAKIVSIKQPAEKARSWFDGVVSIKDVYSVLLPQIVAIREEFDESLVPKEFAFNAGWATLGGITRAVEMENWLAVSGLDHVMKIFDDIENSRLRNVDFVEALACMLGCIGGTFNVENPYVARTNSIKQRAKYENPIKVDDRDIERKLEDGYYFLESPVLPRPTKYFDTDLETSIKRMKERERVYQKLRQTDCGCCGAPTCMAFAEDFVRGEAKLTDCIFLAQKGDEE